MKFVCCFLINIIKICTYILILSGVSAPPKHSLSHWCLKYWSGPCLNLAASNLWALLLLAPNPCTGKVWKKEVFVGFPLWEIRTSGTACLCSRKCFSSWSSLEIGGREEIVKLFAFFGVYTQLGLQPHPLTRVGSFIKMIACALSFQMQFY